MTQVDPQTQVAENGHWTETGDWVQTGPVHQPVNWESGFLDDAVKRRRVLAGLAVCGGTAAVVGSFAAANKMMGGAATESSWEQALTGSSSDPLAIPRQFVEGMEGSVDVMETALVDPARTGNLAVSLDAAESQGENSQAAGATAPAADGSAPADTMAGDPMAGDPMGDADYGTDYGDDNMDGVMGDDPMDVMDDMAKAAGSILVVDPGQEAPKGTLTPDMESVLETVKPAPPAQPKFDPSGPLVDVGSGSGSTAAAVGRRLSFGLNQQLLQEITAMGPSQWIEDQLSKTTGDAAVDSRLPGKSVGNGPTDQLDGDDIRRNLMHTAVYRARYSRHQLFEMMAWMWADHLTVYHGGKNRSVAVYQETVIRPHAMGKFADMLQASAAATAMIYYLDSQSNNATTTTGSTRTTPEKCWSYTRSATATSPKPMSIRQLGRSAVGDRPEIEASGILGDSSSTVGGSGQATSPFSAARSPEGTGLSGAATCLTIWPADRTPLARLPAGSSAGSCPTIRRPVWWRRPPRSTWTTTPPSFPCCGTSSTARSSWVSPAARFAARSSTWWPACGRWMPTLQPTTTVKGPKTSTTS